MASGPGVPVTAVSGSPVCSERGVDGHAQTGWKGGSVQAQVQGWARAQTGPNTLEAPVRLAVSDSVQTDLRPGPGRREPRGTAGVQGRGAPSRSAGSPGEAPLRPGPRRGWERQAVRSWAGFLSWLWVLWRGQGHRGPEHPGCARSGPHMGSSGQALRETEGLLPASKPGSGDLKPLPQPPSLTFHPRRPLPSQSLGAHPRGPRTGNAGFWGSPQAARSAGCVRKLASGATRRVRARNREVVDGTPGPGPPRPGGRAVPQFPRVKQGSWLLRPLGQSSGECARGRDLTVLGVCP